MYGQLMHNTGRELIGRNNRVTRLFEPLPQAPEIDDRPKKAREPEPHVWKVGDKFSARTWTGRVDDCELNREMQEKLRKVQTVRYLGDKEIVCMDGWAWPKSKCVPCKET